MPDPLYRNTSREYPMFNMNIPDQFRATQFIHEIEEKYVKGGEAFPRFIYIHLPNDHMTEPRPQDGYPYEASYVADNDYALGRIVEFLSLTPWWREMAIFVTEDDAQGGRDHIDAHHGVHRDWAVFQAELCVAREHQLSGDVEDHIPAAGIAAAEPVRCGGQRFERLLYEYAGLRRVSGEEGGCADFRSGGGAGAAGSAAVGEDGRSGGGGAVGERGDTSIRWAFLCMIGHSCASLCIGMAYAGNVPNEAKLGFEQVNAMRASGLLDYARTKRPARVKFSKNR